MKLVGALSLAGLAYQQFPFLAKTIQRQIGVLMPHVVIREQHKDELQITDHPIQTGSPVSDHAFRLPAEVTIECAWSESPQSKNLLDSAMNIVGSVKNIASVLTGAGQDQSRAIYELLRKMQDTAVLLNVTTGKRVYKNMLLKSLAVTTEPETENVLMVTAVLREVFIVDTNSATLSSNPDNHADKKQTPSLMDKGKQAVTAAKGFIAK